LIDATLDAAVAIYGDAAAAEFHARLAQKRLCSTQCTSCREIAFPPRPFCPFCHAREVAGVDLPRTGRLYAFTQQHRSLRFCAPDVLGLVELDGVGRILSRIDAPFDSLVTGQPLTLDFLEVSPGRWLHQFRP
jgi:uncharacterized OB-fold protein